LSIAARFGRIEIVRSLIDTCAVDIKASDSFGRTAAWFAKSRGHDAVVSLLAGINRDRDLGADVKGSAHEDGTQHKGTYCDICWLYISGQGHMHCVICECGDFDICLPCFKLGGGCHDKSHELVPVEAEAKN
jgi:hypothetical protein